MARHLILLVLMGLPLTALAVGIEVRPAKLELTSEQPSNYLTVTNPTADVIIYEVYADDFGDLLEINPTSFTLEAGASRQVSITLSDKPEAKSGSLLSTNLSILQKALADSRLQAQVGLKITLTINLVAEQAKDKYPGQTQIIWLSVLAGALLIFGLTKNRRRQRPVKPQ